MQTRVIGVALLLLCVGTATLCGLAIGYKEIAPALEASGQGHASGTPVKGVVKMLVAMIIFTAVGGSIMGTTLCHLVLIRTGPTSRAARKLTT